MSTKRMNIKTVCKTSPTTFRTCANGEENWADLKLAKKKNARCLSFLDRIFEILKSRLAHYLTHPS